MLHKVFENLKNGRFTDITGSELSCKVPLDIGRLNRLLAAAIAEKDVIRRLEVLQITDGKVHLHLTLGNVRLMGQNVEVVDRELVLQLDPVLEAPDFQLRILILEGVGRIENELLELLFSTLFRNKTILFDDHVLKINHREFSDNPTYQNLLKKLTDAHLLTEANQLLYDIRFRF